MPDDYAASIATTGSLSVGGSISGNIETSGDRDWFRISLIAGRTYQFELQGSDTGQGTLLDPTLALFPSSGTLAIATDDDSGSGLNSSLRYFTPNTGTYYLSAAAFSGNGTYRLSATDITPVLNFDDFANSTATVGSLNVGGAITGNIERPDDRDWFRIYLTAGKTYRFDLEGTDTGRGTLFDPFLGLIDSNGYLIHALDDDDGTGLNSNLIFAPITSGFYYLAARGASNNETGTYSLSAIDTGVLRGPTTHSATPSSIPRSLTGDNIIDAATHGYNWQLDNSRTIHWALADGFVDEVWNNAQGTISTIDSIFENISTYANINFNYVGYYDNPPEAFYAGSDITISLDGGPIFDGENGIWAIGIFPSTSNTDHFEYQGAPGDVFINLNSLANALPSYAPGSAGYALIIHELGHVLGLKHPFDDGGTGRPTLASLGEEDLDYDMFSVMAYQDNYNYNLMSWDPATPMILDILALQYLYGPNPRTNAGNSTHTLVQNNQYQTIWDAGGTDTINVLGASEGWEINLPARQSSSLVPTKLGIALPAGEALLYNILNNYSPHTLYWLMGDIENVTGSAFADRLTGNAQANIFNGRGSNDIITGGGGFDVSLYSGAGGGYRLANSFGNRIITDLTPGRDGSDTLSGIERLLFSDGVLAFDNLRSDNAGQGYLIYRAAFDRAPDAAGLGYWIRALDQGQDYGTVVAASFIASEEFIRLNGTNTSNGQFVDLLYQNVLHRAGDVGGFAYWLNELNNGYARSNMLASFAISDENYSAVAPLISDGIFFV